MNQLEFFKNLFKILATVAGGWLAAETKTVLPVMVILVILMMLDYASRLISAWKSGTLNSEKGAKGITKKIGYLLVICCSMCFDFIITYSAQHIGIEISNKLLFGLLATIWYCMNELISIIENVGEFSTVPEWLAKRIENIKDSVAEKGNGEDD